MDGRERIRRQILGLTRGLRETWMWLGDQGVEGLVDPRDPGWKLGPLEPPPRREEPPEPLGEERPMEELTIAAGATLEEIRAVMGDCKRCKLHQKRRNIVFGVGSPQAELVLVGEGPGEEEDRLGEPFVGPAGQLLDRILKAMGLQRGDVYICNVVKCRPPHNRNPEPDEIERCGPFLEAQIQAIRPRALVALGAVGARFLGGGAAEVPLRAYRGRWLDWKGIPWRATYHPAYLLRNPEGRRPVWEDMQQVMGRLGKA